MTLSDELNPDITEAIFSAIPDPFFIFDENGHYVKILGGIHRERYHDGQHLVGRRIHDVMSAKLADSFTVQIKKALDDNRVITYVYRLSSADIRGSETLEGPSGDLWFEANISPIKRVKGRPGMVIWAAFNITRLHNAIEEKDSLIHELKKAMSEIKTLQGILPICSYCKKIRDDKGYWKQVEYYIHEHTGAKFSHGICKECAEKYFGYLKIDDEE
jgi:hypothetical protein